MQAFLELGALDWLEALLLRILLGEDIAFATLAAQRAALRLENERRFPDGTLELVYSPGTR
jgi:hypothetical protein